MFKYALILLTLSISFTSLPTQAADRLVICDTCYSWNDFTQAAIRGIVTPTTDVTKVLNTNSGAFQAFNIYVEIEPGAATMVYALSAAISNSDYQAVSQVMSAKASLLDFFDTSKNIPENLAGSSFDVIQNSVTQTAVSNYYNSTITAGQTWGLYWSAIGSLGGTLAQISFVVDVYFSDGSSAVLRLSGLNSVTSGKVFLLSLLSATDKNGNKVPITRNEFLNNQGFVYTAPQKEDMAALLELADRNGVSSLFFTSSSFGGGGYRNLNSCDCRIIDL
jgi:hypothetical protein